jgi:putative ABC transport system permease protein
MGFRNRRRRELELEQEIRFHLAEEERLLTERGQSPAEARATARREFGNITLVREATRRMWTWNAGEMTLRDCRYALRQLLRNPGFTAVVILNLALGIGANTAIFSVVNAVLLRPLPWRDAARLVLIHEALPNSPYLNVSWPDYNDWRTQNRVFESLGAFQPSRVKARIADRPEMVPAANVTSSFFTALGVQPLSGRLFSEADDRPGAPPVAIVSFRLSRRLPASDKTILIGGEPFTIAGVLQPGFRMPSSEADIFLPLGQNASEGSFTDRANHPGLMAVARLGPGVSLERARGDMDTIMSRLARQYPASNRGETAQIAPLAEVLVGGIRPELLMLFGAVGFVLLLACANVAHLGLARASARRREFAVRLSLGAGRGHLLRQLFVENLWLSLAGAAAGLLVARLAIPPLVRLSPYQPFEVADTRIDPVVLLFTLAVSVTAAVLFGMAPMLQAARSSPNLSAREGADGRSGRRFRSTLFVTEVAIALVLVAGAGLLLESVTRLLRVDPGFRADGLIALDVQRYSNESAGQSLRFFQHAVELIAHQPGVTSVAAAMCPPMSGTMWTSPYWTDATASAAQRPWTALNMITPDYFRTLETPLLHGRLFTDADAAGAPVAIVNRTMARLISPTGDPVGRAIHVQWAAYPRMQIIGVVADISQFGVGRAVSPEVFVPAGQMPVKFMTVVLRAGIDPQAAARAATLAIQSIDRDQPISRVTPLREAVVESIARQRFAATLLGIFGALALLLAATGIFGVMAYQVARRRSEFGVRVALGARRAHLLRAVLADGMRLTAFGVAAGILLAFAVMRLLAGLLYGVRWYDAATLASTVVVMIAVAAAACALPAWRASRVDPMQTLRHE